MLIGSLGGREGRRRREGGREGAREGGRAWFESYVLCLVFLDGSLESPGQEKHFGILFIPLRVIVSDIQL